MSERRARFSSDADEPARQPKPTGLMVPNKAGVRISRMSKFSGKRMSKQVTLAVPTGQEAANLLPIVIEAPCLDLKLTIEADPQRPLSDVILEVLDFRRRARRDSSTTTGQSTVDNVHDFGCSIRSEGGAKLLDSFAAISSFDFPEMQAVWLHPLELSFTVVVEPEGGEGQNVRIEVDPHALVHEAMLKTHKEAGLPGAVQEYSLWIPSSGGATELEAQRLLLFCRLTPQTKLHYSQKSRVVSQHTQLKSIVAGTNDIVVTIKCDALGVEKKMRVPRDITAAELVSRFAEKNPLNNLTQYGLYPMRHYNNGAKLSPIRKLSDYHLGDPCVLYLKTDRMGRAKSTAQRLRMPLQKIRDDLSSLSILTPAAEERPAVRAPEMMQRIGQFGLWMGDAKSKEGDVVPKILLELRRFLEEEGGIETEGIFRLAGREQALHDISAEMCSEDTYVYGGGAHKWGVHEVSSLMKRWFDGMSLKLFSKIPEATMRQLSSVERAKEVELHLDGRNLSLFHFLVAVFAQVVRRFETTKMSAFNLGLVVAPCISCGDDVPPLTQLSITKYAAGIMEHNIVIALKRKSVTAKLSTSERAAGQRGSRDDMDLPSSFFPPAANRSAPRALGGVAQRQECRPRSRSGASLEEAAGGARWAQLQGNVQEKRFSKALIGRRKLGQRPPQQSSSSEPSLRQAPRKAGERKPPQRPPSPSYPAPAPPPRPPRAD